MGTGVSKVDGKQKKPFYVTLANKAKKSLSLDKPKRKSSQDGTSSKHSQDLIPAGTTPTPANQDTSKADQALGHIAYSGDGSYTGAPKPRNEPERINYLCSLNVLDTKPDARFDSITKLCCMLFKVPIALVSLVDKERQWFKSVQGLQTDHTDRKSSFCAWTLLPEYPEVLVVQDTLEDHRFKANPLVTGPPAIRFYAGCPLVASNNLRLGSLCIIDQAPHVFDAESCMMLANLAQMVVKEMEKDKALQQQKEMSAVLTQENMQLLRAIDAFSEGIVLCNVSEPTWPVEFMNDAWQQLTGFNKDDLANGFWSFFRIAGPNSDRVTEAYRAAIEQQQPFELPVYYMDTKRQRREFTLTMRCANTENMDQLMPSVGIPAALQDAHANSAEAMPTYYFATLTQAQLKDQGSTGRVSINDSGSMVSSGRLLGSGGEVVPQRLLLTEGSRDPFGDVKLGQLLGRGSYGRVYRARWNAAQVAVKILEYEQPAEGAGQSSDPGAAAATLDDGIPCEPADGGDTLKAGGEGRGKHCMEQMEALLSTQLSHPNVVQTYKHATRQVGSPAPGGKVMLETWMVMEFCNKGNLTDAIDRGVFRKPGSVFEPDYAALLSTAREVAAAMSYLHDRRILHGDLTPNNILLAAAEKDKRQYSAKVCDFGLSRILGVEAEQVQTRTHGTITHMPPEVLLDGSMSFKSDVYAFGVIIWEMVMAQRPWMGLSHGQIIHSISSGKQLQLGSGVPSSMRKFLQRCMARKPEERPSFQQILGLLDDLDDDLVGHDA